MTINTDRLFVDLGASQVRRRLKGQRIRRSQGRNRWEEAVFIHTATREPIVAPLELQTEDDRMPYQDELQEADDAITVRLACSPDDGLLVFGLKLLCVPFGVYHRHVFSRAMRTLNRLSASLLALACPGVDVARFANQQLRVAIDLYMLLWTFILLIAYLLTYWLTATGRTSCLADLLVGAASLLAAIRAYEIIAFVMLLHVDPQYRPPALARAVLGTLWHYCELALIWAQFFIASSRVGGVGFHGGHLTDSCITPVYFSFVTITTLGYGDIFPERWWSRLLAMGEVVAGVFLLIIVLQKGDCGWLIAAQQRCRW